ncbi:type I-E CRISPR-associated protein Cse1/CasA [Scardovia wiggsiae]|uniref:type I-E CRISPR-associated protein Cse1/CasA n=2 Tax=Scardovia wiggsiae TaxID=230143 RepID=UPI003BADA0DA
MRADGNRHILRMNLLDDPWILAIDKSGSECEISLTEALESAQEYKEITGDIPQQVMPILRLMLAILYRAYQKEGITQSESMDIWVRAWQDNHFNMGIVGSYLERIHDLFYLFDEKRPFMQESGIKYALKKDGKERDTGLDGLVADFPKSEKFLFTMRQKGSLNSLTAAEAARWLLYIQNYDIAGIHPPLSDSTTWREYALSGQIQTGLLGSYGGIFVQGKNLFETLMSNWVLYLSISSPSFLSLTNDAPSWEKPLENELKMRPDFTGPADLFTFQSRRVRLIPSKNEVTGFICSYGVYPKVSSIPSFETMTMWERAKKKQAKDYGIKEGAYIPRQHDPERYLWQGLSSLLPVEDELKPGVLRWVSERQNKEILDDLLTIPEIVTIHAQGIIYDRPMKSKVENGINDTLDIAHAVLNKESQCITDILEVLCTIDRSVRDVAATVCCIRGLANKANMKNRYQSFSNSIKGELYFALDELCRTQIAHFDMKNKAESKKQWLESAHRILLKISEHHFDSIGGSWNQERMVDHSSMYLGDKYCELKRELDCRLGVLEKKE